MVGGRDQDGDGKISKDELVGGLKQLLEQADADKDGALTQAELDAARPQGGRGRRGGGEGGPPGDGQPPQGGPPGGGPPRDPAVMEQLFKRFDTNSDGSLSPDEVKAMSERGGRGMGGGRGGRRGGGQGGEGEGDKPDPNRVY